MFWPLYFYASNTNSKCTTQKPIMPTHTHTYQHTSTLKYTILSKRQRMLRICNLTSVIFHKHNEWNTTMCTKIMTILSCNTYNTHFLHFLFGIFPVSLLRSTTNTNFKPLFPPSFANEKSNDINLKLTTKPNESFT